MFVCLYVTVHCRDRFVIMDIIAFEAKLDMLDKRLKEAQKDRQRHPTDRDRGQNSQTYKRGYKLD